MLLDRAAHQLHALKAREALEPPYEDAEVYGLGASRVQVELVLDGGQVKRLNVGAITPSGVSHYVSIEGYPTIYIVKRAAVEYLRAPMTDYRHDRPFQRDVFGLVSVVANNDLMERRWRRDNKTWALSDAGEPFKTLVDSEGFEASLIRLLNARVTIAQDAEDSGEACREGELRLNTSTDKTEVFCGVERGANQRIRLRWSGAPETVWIPARLWDWVWDAFHVGSWDQSLVKNASQADTLVIRRGSAHVVIARSVDGWRWDDNRPVLGATPTLITRALEQLKPTPYAGTKVPDTEEIELNIRVSGEEVRVSFVRAEALTVMRVEAARYVVAPAIWEHLTDLVKEHGRHVREKRERRGPSRWQGHDGRWQT